MLLTLADIQRAWELKDPAFIDYVITLAEQPNPPIETPLPDSIETFESFINYIWTTEFRGQPYETQMSYRVEHIAHLEHSPAPYMLPERLKLHEMITVLWRDKSPYARYCLIQIIRRVPVIFGPWKALKAIYKQAEALNDYELVAEIAVRVDENRHTWTQYGVSAATKTYIALRGWRYLRKLGQAQPVSYVDSAVYYLAAYTDSYNWSNHWIYNHILYHNKPHAYGLNTFSYIEQKTSVLQHRAFKSLWQRSPEPLFRLLTLARTERIRDFAAQCLKGDFAPLLRDIDPSIIIQLGGINIRSAAIDELIVFLLENASKLEKQQFRTLGLHTTVLKLLESASNAAQRYAVEYTKAHARDLEVNHLLRLAKNTSLSASVRDLALQLLTERDPRKEVGLEAWGQLLESEQHYKIASEVVRKNFSKQELTPEWFKQRLLANTKSGFEFVKTYLVEFHPLKALGVGFFEAIIADVGDDYGRTHILNFALDSLNKLDLKDLNPEFIQTQLLNRVTQKRFITWISQDDIKAKVLPIDYYQALAYEPDFNKHPFIQHLRTSLSWGKGIAFNTELAEKVREWLSDVRRFAPNSLGFEWLMQLVSSETVAYHDFAVERLSKAFVPADFAPQSASPTTAAPVDAQAPITVDLQGQTFLFTGKMQSMTREQAEVMVTQANGKNSGSVTAKLAYLVIGDEGSPFYGNGRKGSKQVKAESLNADGAGIKIISETAFLQMMSGQQREVSGDAALVGTEYLWNLALGETDTPLRQFALQYLRRHHPVLSLKATDRPVDPGAEIPASFLTFDHVASLLQHPHAPVRQLGVDLAQEELARWQPSDTQLLLLSESRQVEVRDLLKRALLDEPTAFNKTYHLATDTLSASFVYGLCESRSAASRELGLQILQRERRLQQPNALFQLTESPDREVRNRVIRILWSLYRKPVTTEHWKPNAGPQHLMGKAAKASKTPAPAPEVKVAQGLPERPETWPADQAALQLLLKRWLYELPPGRLGRDQASSGQKPLAASLAKRALIETIRDLALEDAAFAELVLPLFQQFTGSRGKMEQAASLVAVTRIEHAYPDLVGATV